MRNTYHINKTFRANQTSYRYWKLVYTAALRLGEAVKLEPTIIIEFEGDLNHSIAPSDYEHNASHQIYLGCLFLNGKKFENIVFIHNKRSGNRPPEFVTFWPHSDRPEAKHSTTQPLITIAMNDNPIPPEEVVKEMYPVFKKDPGINPLVLINRLKNVAEQQLDELIRIAEDVASERDSLKIVHEELEAAFEEYVKETQKRQKQFEAALADIASEIRISRDGQSNKTEPCQLIEVFLINHNGKPNVKLVLSDGSHRLNNWKNKQAERFAYASALVGRIIETDSWRDFNPRLWFDNIWPVENQLDNIVENVNIVEVMEPNDDEYPERWQRLKTASGHLVWNDLQKLGGHPVSAGETLNIIRIKWDNDIRWHTTF